MASAEHHQIMFPIAHISVQQTMRRALIGANANDPVLPERRRGRRPRPLPAAQPSARLALRALKPRGTS
jgi:hypothetical protein